MHTIDIVTKMFWVIINASRVRIASTGIPGLKSTFLIRLSMKSVSHPLFYRKGLLVLFVLEFQASNFTNSSRYGLLLMQVTFMFGRKS